MDSRGWKMYGYPTLVKTILKSTESVCTKQSYPSFGSFRNMPIREFRELFRQVSCSSCIVKAE